MSQRTFKTAEIETPSGLARVHLASVPDARALLMLGHGAGGGVQAPDIQAAAVAALEEGVSIALVEQPYRVAGRRSPAPAAQLDAAWEAVARELAQPTLIVGGRSSGARVAWRKAVRAWLRSLDL